MKPEQSEIYISRPIVLAKMTEREEFLAALTEDSAFGFNKLMKRHVSIGRVCTVILYLLAHSKAYVYDGHTLINAEQRFLETLP